MLKILLFGLIAAGAEILGGTFIVLRKDWPSDGGLSGKAIAP